MMSIAEIFGQMLRDWPAGTLVGIYIIAGTFGLFGLLMWLFLSRLDTFFVPQRCGIGRVLHKKFTPAHTGVIMTYNPASNTSTPQPIVSAQEWSVCVDMDGRTNWVSVRQKLYNAVSPGSHVVVVYVVGRFSGKLYLHGLNYL